VPWAHDSSPEIFKIDFYIIIIILVPLPKEGLELEYLAITDGSTIERLILHRNIRHFRKAESTPLATPEVIRKIGFGADTERSELL
jgi:hypothetical protein